MSILYLVTVPHLTGASNSSFKLLKACSPVSRAYRLLLESIQAGFRRLVC